MKLIKVIPFIRFAYRLAVLEKRQATKANAVNALVIGAGENGSQTIKLLSIGVQYRPVAVIDTSSKDAGKLIDGIPVYGIDEFEKDKEYGYNLFCQISESMSAGVTYLNFKNNQGQYDTDFIDCVSFEKTPFISKYFHKGDSIIVTGELQTRIWTDDNGKKRKSYIVNVAKAYFGLAMHR